MLKERYPLTWTHTKAVDDGFTEDVPIIVAQAGDRQLRLYEDGGLFVMYEKRSDQTDCTHWHPVNVLAAMDDIVAFMDER